jgi:lipid-binding SYLF domain-containing protein
MRIISRRQAVSLALSSLAFIGSVTGSQASSAREIDANVDATLREFSLRIGGARELLAKSAAVLVFPSVIKAGMGIGGEYGEGALLTRERTTDYYNIISASIGFQLGAQQRAVIIVFMTPEALASFRRTQGWKVGVDASVAIITVGAGGSIDSSRISSPIVGFIFDQKGLMYNLTLEGSKITRINP